MKLPNKNPGPAKGWPILGAMFLFTFGLTAGENAPFSPGRLSFSVKFKQEISNYHTLAISALPHEKLPFVVVDPSDESDYEIAAEGGTLTAQAPRHWQWEAPEKPGLYPLRLTRGKSRETMTLNLFVIVPLSKVKDGLLNGYRIGTYPAIPLRDLAIYKPPRGFVEVTPELEEVWVSPHFQLKPFICKQVDSGYPKYIIIRERLLLKLELILEQVNAKGIRCDTFALLSGFRTPYYNKLIGNVKYSRHTWGGAADIFVDVNPRDGMMDDLNKDGKINVEDALFLYEMVDDMYGKPWYDSFKGGLGNYSKTESHGPFIHIDVRGFRARWGH